MEFKEGMADPSRITAFCEKAEFVKKNVGKKKLINDKHKAHT
jgi:hypothetical protein